MEGADIEQNLLLTPPDAPPTYTGAPRIIIEDDAGRDLGDAHTAASTTAGGGACSPVQATLNVIQVFMGIGLLSMPYAMALSGWAGLGALLLSLIAFRASAGLLDAGLGALQPGTPKTYAALGAAALGPAFRPVVGALAVAEFGGGATLTLAIVYKQAALLVPAAAAATPACLVAAVVGLLLPALALPSFRRLTPLSAVGCISTALVALAVLACAGADPLRERFGGGSAGATTPPGHGGLRPGIIRALGIFSMAVSGHSSLPALRSSMADPSIFPSVLNAAFAAMGVAYGATAAAGYWYFGDAASAVVTANLATDAPFARASLLPPSLPKLTVAALVGWAVLLNAFTTLPSMVMVVDSTLWSLTSWASGNAISAGGGEDRDGWLCRPGVGPGAAALRRPRRSVRFVMRFLIAIASAALGALAASSLGNAVALVGGVAALSCSLILPTVCYARVVGVDGYIASAGLVSLLAGGVVLTGLIVAQSVAAWAR